MKKWIQDSRGFWHVHRTMGISPHGTGPANLTACNLTIEKAVAGLPREVPDHARRCSPCDQPEAEDGASLDHPARHDSLR